MQIYLISSRTFVCKHTQLDEGKYDFGHLFALNNTTDNRILCVFVHFTCKFCGGLHLMIVLVRNIIMARFCLQGADDKLGQFLSQDI